MVRGKRRKYDDAFKARVAIETIKEAKTLTELAGQYGVHPNQIRNWKNEFLENAAMVFGGDKDTKARNEKLEKERENLHKRIGEQTMQIDFLKKNLKKLPSSISKCNTWESEGRCGNPSVYEQRI